MNQAARLIRTVMLAMFCKRWLAGAIIAFACIAGAGPQVARAAQMKVDNVVRVGADSVQFDISWTNSWRASWNESGAKITNWDAAWVFVKYRRKGDPGWSHATLSTKDSDHSAPAGAKINSSCMRKARDSSFGFRGVRQALGNPVASESK